MQRSLFEYHPVVGYRFIPGLKTRVAHEGGGYLVLVNSSGFRCRHELTREKPEGTTRILLFGDSHTAGDGVSNGKRFGDVLETLLPGKAQVLNFGLPGTGTDQQFLAYREFAAGIEHDLLLLVVQVENIQRVAARYRYYADEQGRRVLYAKPYFELAGGRLVLCHVPPQPAPLEPTAVPEGSAGNIDEVARYPLLSALVRSLTRVAWARKILVSGGLKDRVQGAMHYQPVPHYSSPRNPAWLLLAAILREWIGEHSGPVLLVPLPFYHYVSGLSDARPYQARFRELAATLDCAYFDPLPVLQANPREVIRRMYFENDGHLTAEGHAAVAAALAPAITAALAGRRQEMSA
jgi:carbamoyltransferase